jgi:hypothetical protein
MRSSTVLSHPPLASSPWFQPLKLKERLKHVIEHRSLLKLDKSSLHYVAFIDIHFILCTLYLVLVLCTL